MANAGILCPVNVLCFLWVDCLPQAHKGGHFLVVAISIPFPQAQTVLQTVFYTALELPAVPLSLLEESFPITNRGEGHDLTPLFQKFALMLSYERTWWLQSVASA